MRHITRTVKAVAAAAAITAIWAGSASAAIVDKDPIDTIGDSSFKFTSGNVNWWYKDGKYTTPLTGTLKLDDANGSCARIRMEYFDNGTSISTKYGGSVCAPDGKAHSYNVDLDPFKSSKTDLLKVSVQKKTASKDWSIVESAYFKPTTSNDKVGIAAQGVDLGDVFYTIDPSLSSATMTWKQGDGTTITPWLYGGLYLDNMAGDCARVRLTYYTTGGKLLTSKYSGNACAPDNHLYEAEIDLSPYSGPDIGKVRVTTQTQASNGSWLDVKSKTVHIDVNMS